MRVAIVGGGYAGIAAAIDLAEHGIPIHLFEAAKHLGGRARRINYEGLNLDNGQHILIGAYRHTLDYIRKLHGDSALDRVLYRLPFEINLPGNINLKAAALPSPFHLLAGILTAQGLSIKERISIIRFVTKLKLKDFCLTEDCTVKQLLETHAQSPKLITYLWEPLCVAALNTPIEQASAQIYLKVLHDSLMGSSKNSELLIPKVDLSELLPDIAAEYIIKRGGIIEYGRPVLSIQKNETDYRLEFKEREHYFTHIICAVAPQHFTRLTEHLPELLPFREMLSSFTYQPIYTFYLQYPETVSLTKAISLLDSNPGQWVFDRGIISGAKGLIAVVISASGNHQQFTQDELAQQIHQQLSRIWDLPEPKWYKAIAEKRATFTCTPNLPRPTHTTPYKNFFLAGDYTEPAYPATIESAIKSGHECAQQLLATL